MYPPLSVTKKAGKLGRLLGLSIMHEKNYIHPDARRRELQRRGLHYATLKVCSLPIHPPSPYRAHASGLQVHDVWLTCSLKAWSHFPYL